VCLLAGAAEKSAGVDLDEAERAVDMAAALDAEGESFPKPPEEQELAVSLALQEYFC
jgi:hypothetical protein